jgi:hypothetical protein
MHWEVESAKSNGLYSVFSTQYRYGQSWGGVARKENKQHSERIADGLVNSEKIKI